MTETPRIYPAMAAILADAEPIAKDQYNKIQNFNFRGIDDAYNSLHKVMAEHKVFTVPRVLSIERSERPAKNGGILGFSILMVEYDFVSGEDGSHITVGPMAGEAMDSGDKSCNKAMAVAHKYALFQTLMIPTLFDADADSPEPAAIVLATDEQLATIKDFDEAGNLPDQTRAWMAKQEPFTTEMAAALINKLQGAE